jgi:hypothetical protein
LPTVSSWESIVSIMQPVTHHHARNGCARLR